MCFSRRHRLQDFKTEYPGGGKRFVRAYKQGAIEGMEIWVDQQTGVNYLFRQVGYAGGLTVMLDRDGRPLITGLHG